MVRYVLRRSDRDGVSRPLKAAAVLRRARRALRRQDAPETRAKRRGQVRWRHFPDAEGAIDYARRAFPGEVGQVVELAAGELTLYLRTVETEPPTIQTEGNSKIDLIYTAVVRAFKVSNYGICSRRNIAGSSSWTQHCPWPAPDPGSNAWDIGASFSQLSKVKDFLFAEALAYQRTNGSDGLPIGRWIFNRQIWDPVQGVHPYTGSDPHTGHIHCEGLPERTGQPRASCP